MATIEPSLTWCGLDDLRVLFLELNEKKTKLTKMKMKIREGEIALRIAKVRCYTIDSKYLEMDKNKKDFNTKLKQLKQENLREMNYSNNSTLARPRKFAPLSEFVLRPSTNFY